MTVAVVDTSVVVACALDERGAEVAERLAGCLLSAVNAAEVVARLKRDGLTLAAISGVWTRLGLVLVPFDEALAVAAGDLEAATRPRGLSLGDRACLALALREGLSAMTADRAWAEVDAGVEINLIR